LDEKEKEWYSNKELYEMMVALSKRLEKTSAELEKTQVLIRDYNGLREKVGKLEKKIGEFSGKATGGKEMWGYIIGGIGLLLAILGWAVK